MREIICLSACGYPDGALSLARNIYEQLITLAFLENQQYSSDFSQYVEDYYIDYDIQRCKALLYEYKKCTDDVAQLTAISQELNTSKQAAHRNTKGKYWWTGYSNFGELADAVIASVSDDKVRKLLYGFHFSYKRACVSIHSSCLGNTLRLGVPQDFAGIDTSPQTTGHSLPLWFSTSSLIYVFGIVYKVLNLDYKELDYKLNEIADFFYKKELT